MRKFVLMFVAASTLFVGCKKDELPPQEEKPEVKTEASLKIEYLEEFDNVIYPSFVYTYAGLRDKNGNPVDNNYFELTINANQKFDAKLRVTNSKFADELVTYKTIKKGTNKIEVSPKWKFDNFINITTPGQTYFNFEIIDTKDNKAIATESFRMSYRSINECVFALDRGKKDFRSFFAAYVNEDSRLIDAFLSQAMRNHNQQYNYPLKLYGWTGYQNGSDYLALQVVAIVNQLRQLGMKYSSITNTSNYSDKVASQYVRTIDESLFLQNANCVDGTVLLASILEKIGIRCFFSYRARAYVFSILQRKYRDDS